MAIAPAVGQIYSVTFDLTMFGQKLMNTFQYRLGTIGTAITTDDVCDGMNTVMNTAGNMYAKYRACVTAQVTHNNTWIQVAYPARQRKKVYAIGVAGSWTGTAYTANTAVSIERYGPAANRHNIGRVQIPSADDATSINNGLVSGAGYLTVLNAFAAQMLQPLTTAAGSVLGPVLVRSPIDGNYEFLLGTSVQTTVRVMRRRTVGVGK